ncbi:hypothetical protein BDFB_009353, partial [Asbolus verrucosus]
MNSSGRLVVAENNQNKFKLLDVYNPGFQLGSVVLISNHSGNFEEYMLDPRYKQFDIMSKFHYTMFLLLEEVHNFT